MTVFDLVFIVLFFATVFTLLTAAVFAVRKQFHRAGRILLRLLVCGVVYFAIVIAVSLFSPRRIMKFGDRQCFDDMCVSVEGFKKQPGQAGVKYDVDLRLSNRGRGVAQRENGLVMYLTDDHGRRYDPAPDDSYKPFNTRLEPQESARLSRSFLVPEGAQAIGAVVTHEGGFPIGWLIIDYDTWFRKPPLVPLY
jgi:hypothetical protein